MKRLVHTSWVLALILIPPTSAGELDPLLDKIKAVGREGAGNVEAARAWRELTQRGPGALIEILTALDDASPRAANWLRTAVAAIAERTVEAGKPLPAGQLEGIDGGPQPVGGPRR